MLPSAPLQLITLQVNRKSYTIELEPCVSLLDALREVIGLIGAKKGCDRGQAAPARYS
jgi:xanthine dehydrogenase YagT iron-sulfur-binding subunit